MTRLTGAEPKADNATGKLDKGTAGHTGQTRQTGQPGQMDRELNVQPAQLVKWTGGTTRALDENYMTNTADTSYADVQFGGNQRR